MNIFETIASLTNRNRPFVIATVVETTGSSPGKEHFKAVIDRDGLVAGTVGGGAIEKEVIAQARRLLGEKGNLLKTYNLSSGPDNLGMQCGGTTTIFYEYIGARDNVFVFGGGHISQSLTPLLKSIDFYVTLVENREEFAARDLHPSVDEIVHSDYTRFIENTSWDPSSFVVIVTPAHKYETEILHALFRRAGSLRYIGVIASKRKSVNLRKELETAFPGDDRIAHIHTPIGLDIGGETPAQIALSIAAQIQAVRFNKDIAGGP
ncbi:MAG: XdhC family protein [Chlorobi bacterium]|nr:XdhC family protein [Chlorobiota bacterium]